MASFHDFKLISIFAYMKDKKDTGNERIKAARSLKKITQKELAEMTGLTQTTITKIERGETTSPSIDIAIKIANALGENVYKLFANESLLLNSPDSFKSLLPSDNQINELKAENEALKDQIGTKNRESLLHVKIIDGLENEIKSLKGKIEAINEHLITWPEYYILAFNSELRADFKENRISEAEAVKRTNTVYNIVAMAFLFSTGFKVEFIDNIEKRLKKMYESIYDYDFKLFINMMREVQADHEDFEEKIG